MNVKNLEIKATVARNWDGIKVESIGRWTLEQWPVLFFTFETVSTILFSKFKQNSSLLWESADLTIYELQHAGNPS